jgi:hypothetical protein
MYVETFTKFIIGFIDNIICISIVAFKCFVAMWKFRQLRFFFIYVVLLFVNVPDIR